MNLNNLTIEEAKALLKEVSLKARAQTQSGFNANEKIIGLENSGDTGSQFLGNLRKERKMYRLEKTESAYIIQELMHIIDPDTEM